MDALLATQGGSCAICGRQYEDKPGFRLAVDHDHRHCPGRVGCPQCIRGLICNEDNNILRLAHDDPERLRMAMAYLDRWEKVRATERDW